MDQRETIELQILQEVETKGEFTQRDLASSLEIALGLSNAYIRRLVEKGYVMVTTMPRKRVVYNLTPKGIVEKGRLTLLYMRDSVDYYRKLRETIGRTLAEMHREGADRLVILGTGEIAEIAYIMVKHQGMRLVAVVEIEPKAENFLGLAVKGPADLAGVKYDAILVAQDLAAGADALARVIEERGLPVEKMVTFLGNRIATEDGKAVVLPPNALLGTRPGLDDDVL